MDKFDLSGKSKPKPKRTKLNRQEELELLVTYYKASAVIAMTAAQEFQDAIIAQLPEEQAKEIIIPVMERFQERTDNIGKGKSGG